jgi:hypothetical protein
MLHAQPISSFLTWSVYLCLVRSTSCEAPHYAVFSSLPSLHPSTVLFSTLCHIISLFSLLCRSISSFVITIYNLSDNPLQFFPYRLNYT